jgi:uncharacterized protein YbcI
MLGATVYEAVVARLALSPSSRRATFHRRDGTVVTMSAEVSSNGSLAAKQTELSELSNAMVRIYKEQFGRGPTKTRTAYAGPNTIVTTLEESMTAAERSMVKRGAHLRVTETRLWFQEATREEFINTVQAITGREVRAFMSGMDSYADVAVETFSLVPVAP